MHCFAPFFLAAFLSSTTLASVVRRQNPNAAGGSGSSGSTNTNAALGGLSSSATSSSSIPISPPTGGASNGPRGPNGSQAALIFYDHPSATEPCGNVSAGNLEYHDIGVNSPTPYCFSVSAEFPIACIGRDIQDQSSFLPGEILGQNATCDVSRYQSYGCKGTKSPATYNASAGTWSWASMKPAGSLSINCHNQTTASNSTGMGVGNSSSAAMGGSPAATAGAAGSPLSGFAGSSSGLGSLSGAGASIGPDAGGHSLDTAAQGTSGQGSTGSGAAGGSSGSATS